MTKRGQTLLLFADVDVKKPGFSKAELKLPCQQPLVFQFLISLKINSEHTVISYVLEEV